MPRARSTKTSKARQDPLLIPTNILMVLQLFSLSTARIPAHVSSQLFQSFQSHLSASIGGEYATVIIPIPPLTIKQIMLLPHCSTSSLLLPQDKS